MIKPPFTTVFVQRLCKAKKSNPCSKQKILNKLTRQSSIIIIIIIIIIITIITLFWAIWILLMTPAENVERNQNPLKI